MCIDLWEWAENVFCACVCLTMLTRDHPPQSRHSTTRWTEWFILWLPVSLSPWLPQGWHGRALKWVTMMAGINDKQKQTSWAHPFKADLATDTVACLTYQWTLSPQYGIIIHRDQPGICDKLISPDHFLSNYSSPAQTHIWIRVCFPWPSASARITIQRLVECLIINMVVRTTLPQMKGTIYGKEVWQWANDQGTHWF